jgi:alpha galactosidase A-like protein/concanavalin A-like lectin/glucanase superfamily protein/alpha galactosidase C-like protein
MLLAMLGCAAACLIGAPAAQALDDGLARTPPMGFNNWNSTFCGPQFNEEMIRGMADIFVRSGLKDAGYEYINIDDCWARPQNHPLGSRDAEGHLVVDANRFPNGIEALADYVHGSGLKFGIYHDTGTRTCNGQGFDGTLGFGYQAGDPTFEAIDAQDFADWGVDYVKHDWCNVPLGEIPGATVDDKARFLYTGMSEALRATGRPIVFSIATLGDTRVRPWEWGAGVGHLWRTTGDIRANYESMSNIAKFNMTLDEYAGPGHWNDADMLQVGNAAEGGGSWNATEQKTHFSLWSIMASPLLIGTDLREATPETMRILVNEDVIAVNQDPLGVQADVVRHDEAPPVPATRAPGQDGFGNAVRLNGPGEPNRYVEMPAGIVSGLTDFTIAAWVNRASTEGQSWSRIFDFGTGTGVNMFLTPDVGGAPGVRFAITTSGSGGEQQISAAEPLATGWQHVAVTLSGTTGTLYVNGEPVATNPNMTLTPSGLGTTTNNWIGRSQYADPALNATVDEFQIYDHALTQPDIQSLMDSPGGTPGGGDVAWYRFDEEAGAQALDASGNARHATVITSLDDEGYYVLAKPLANGDVAVALWNDTASTARIRASAAELGLPPTRGIYLARDLWTKKVTATKSGITATVPAHGTAMYRVTKKPPQG